MSKPYKIVAKVGTKLQWESKCLKDIIEYKYNLTYSFFVIKILRKTILSYKREALNDIISKNINIVGTHHPNNPISRIKHYV